MSTFDPVSLSEGLIRCPSITPVDAGALDVLQGFLERAGFVCHRQIFEDVDTPPVDNLYARLGTTAPNLCFAGHTDVVPPGDEDLWTNPPFEPTISDGRFFGRGATDMKCAIAAFAVAAARVAETHGTATNGSISLLITGDEEGISINGTKKALPWITDLGEVLDACIVGEPTNPHVLGEMAKIGRRGSLNGQLVVNGVQGHAAYPHMADNPIPHLVRMLSALIDEPLDDGSDHFQPSTLTVTTVDVGNATTNVIPAEARAGFNVRFNDNHTSMGVEDIIRARLDRIGADYELSIRVSGESFLSPPGALSDVVVSAVEHVTGKQPELSTTGGTSDARFIKDYCPIVEFGMISDTAHKTDEHVLVDDIHRLSDIYARIIQGYLGLTEQ
jgi:succinyl-diaminopimelate desuccinylase